MSRSNHVKLKNPASKFYQWDGTNGGFNYWDKQQEKRIHIGLPFEFMVLDTLSTVKGYDDMNQSGYWSNEVRNVAEDEIVIRNSKGICAKGKYGEIIKDCTGARYCQSVYVATWNGENLELANIQFMGSALSAWIEFRKKNKVYSGKIVVDEMLDGKKGATNYKIPVYRVEVVDPSLDDQAKALDVELQDYLGAYLKNKSEKNVVELSQDETLMPTDNDKEPLF